MEGALGLGGHVVIGVVRLVARFHHADEIPIVEFSPSGFCSPIVHRENGSFEVLSLHFQCLAP